MREGERESREGIKRIRKKKRETEGEVEWRGRIRKPRKK